MDAAEPVEEQVPRNSGPMPRHELAMTVPIVGSCNRGRRWRVVAFWALAACATTPPRAVTAPADAPTAKASAHDVPPAPREDLDACALDWTLYHASDDSGSVIVVCGNEVRRELLSRSAALRAAIAPALEPARQRVCACAARQLPPPSVDLVITVMPARGRASVEGSVSGEADDEADPARAPFIACIGTVAASFPPLQPAGACETGVESTLKYPVHVELAR
jgi:hypothetical protein